MRVDKFLKLSRIIKRRTVAHDAASKNHILVNDKPAKPSKEIKVDDIITVKYFHRIILLKVLKLDERANKDSAKDMYEIIEIKEQ